MRAVALAGLLGLAACGDNVLPPANPMFVGESGSWLKLQWYLYQDGTRQLETQAFYDARQHARCKPRVWSDGVTRCVPLAEDSVFVDDQCTTEVGQMKLVRKPTHFIGNDRIAGKPSPNRFFRAGTMTDVPARFYERRDDQCIEIARDLDVQQYFTLDGPYEGDRLIEVWPEQLARDERIGLDLLTSAEGLSAPTGYYDHQLDLPCRPERMRDGTTACAPTESIVAEHFADPYCEQPVLVAAAVPRVATVADAYACPTYRAIAGEHTALTYRREGTACVRASLATTMHAYRVGEPLPLAELARTVENVPKRRLQRIVLQSGNLTTLDGYLFDFGTRGECKSFGNGELALCVPANSAVALKTFSNPSCTIEQPIAEVPRVTCSRPEFAVTDAPSIHAITTPLARTAYQLDAFGNCRPHVTPTSAVAYSLGPAIPPETFAGGVVFSDR